MKTIDNYLLDKTIPDKEKNTMLLCYINNYKNNSSYSLIQLIDMQMRMDYKIKNGYIDNTIPRSFDLNIMQMFYVTYCIIIVYVMAIIYSPLLTKNIASCNTDNI